MDPNLLPDQALAQAAQSGAPGIPSWLALATLQKRNQIRQSAPQQSPQGTVAQSVVAQALRGNGIAPQNAPQSPTNAPQSNGIAAMAPTTKMAKGGPVRFAGGSDSGGISSQAQNPYGGIVEGLQNLNLVPRSTTITSTPVDYSPAVKPDVGDLNSSVSKIAPLYGPSPDYAGNLASIKANLDKNGTIKYGPGEYISDLVGGVLGGKSVSPTNNFGSSLLNANATQREVQQQNFKNQTEGQNQILATQQAQQERAAKIAQSAQAYYALHAQLANSEAQTKAYIQAGNQQRAQEAQEKTAEIALRVAQATNQSINDFADPNHAASVAAFAQSKGDTATAAYAKAAQDQFFKNAQASSDIEQKRMMAVEQARAAAERSVEAMRIAGEKQLAITKSNMDNAFLGIHFDSNGNMVKLSNASGTPGGEAVPAATGNSVPDSLPGNYPNLVKTAGENWLKDPSVTNGGKMGGDKLQKLNLLAQNYANDVLMPMYGIKSNDLSSMRLGYQEAIKDANRVVSQKALVESAERNIEAQLPQFVAMAERLKTSGIDINAPKDVVKKFFGADNNAYAAYDGAVNTIAAEYAKVLKGVGQVSDQDKKEALEVLNRGMSSGSVVAATNQMKFDMSQRIQAYEDKLANDAYMTRTENLARYAKTGQPIENPLVSARRSLPDGQNKQIDPHSPEFQKFYQVALLQSGYSSDESVRKNPTYRDPDPQTVQDNLKHLLYAKGWQ